MSGISRATSFETLAHASSSESDWKCGQKNKASKTVIPGDAKHRTRNLEIPGLVLRTIPE
jgi:hypothetical protein